MTLAITPETPKNTLNITNDTKTGQNETWAERGITWAESGAAGDTFAIPATAFTPDLKNTLSITPETKN